MTGLAAHGVPMGVARTAIELTVLLSGWTLGGTIGIATAIFALAIGPLVTRALPLITLSPRKPDPDRWSSVKRPLRCSGVAASRSRSSRLSSGLAAVVAQLGASARGRRGPP